MPILIRKACTADAHALKELYFHHLTKYPPQEEQDMTRWEALLIKMEQNELMHLLVMEADGHIVSSLQLAIIENLTHNIRPFAIIENVVTHSEYRCRGYASALLQRATEIAIQHNCYKITLETGSNRESTLNFYRKNGFSIDEKHCCLKRL